MKQTRKAAEGIRRLSWAALAPAQAFHLARQHLPPDNARGLHDHDFAEVFWVESGLIRHRCRQEERTLAAGTLVFVHPGFAHDCLGGSAAGGVLVNLAFPRAWWRELERRYAGGEEIWGNAEAARYAQLSPADLPGLAAWTEQLARGPGDRLELDAFLLELLRLARHRAGPAPLPDWLAAAFREIERNGDWDGVWTHLRAQTGRTREHISRTIRRSAGMTATALINTLRLRHAAGLLRLSDRPILQICYDCGFSNISHFYRLFAAAHGQTPRRYRLAQRLPVSTVAFAPDKPGA